jgi:hypothetical protein
MGYLLGQAIFWMLLAYAIYRFGRWKGWWSGTRRSCAVVMLCVVIPGVAVENGPAFWRGFVQGLNQGVAR